VNYDNLLKDKLEIVKELHSQGLSQNQIANRLGHSGGRISVLLKKHGIPAHSVAKYSVDETFFDKIDSRVKAFILGWFYSDGCVDQQGKMRIQIQESDMDVLNFIKKSIKYTGDLYKIKPRNDRCQPQVCLCINRKRLADSLIRLGCVPAKSLVLEFPDSSIVPTEYLNSFLLGYFQGDGGISKYTTHITSSDIFLFKLKDILTEMNIDSQIYYRYTNKNCASLQISKIKNSFKFLRWIHQDAPYIMERKYEKFQNLEARLNSSAI
jgi:hypothetical protein